MTDSKELFLIMQITERLDDAVSQHGHEFIILNDENIDSWPEVEPLDATNKGHYAGMLYNACRKMGDYISSFQNDSSYSAEDQFKILQYIAIVMDSVFVRVREAFFSIENVDSAPEKFDISDMNQGSLDKARRVFLQGVNTTKYNDKKAR